MSKYFGGLKAVNDLSFQVEERKIAGIIGPNGAGNLYRTWSPNTYTMRGQGQDLDCKNYWMDSTLDTYDDFGAEIDAQPNSKSAEYGIAFRADGNPRNAQNWYAFSVNTLGAYRFRKRINGQYSGSDLILSTPSKDIKPGQARNRLGVLANGSTLSFYINGNLVNTSKDASFSRGRVGFYICPFQDSIAEVAFNRMTIFTVDQAQKEWSRTTLSPTPTRVGIVEPFDFENQQTAIPNGFGADLGTLTNAPNEVWSKYEIDSAVFHSGAKSLKLSSDISTTRWYKIAKTIPSNYNEVFVSYFAKGNNIRKEGDQFDTCYIGFVLTDSGGTRNYDRTNSYGGTFDWRYGEIRLSADQLRSLRDGGSSIEFRIACFKSGEFWVDDLRFEFSPLTP
jgi:hypothetical protein